MLNKLCIQDFDTVANICFQVLRCNNDIACHRNLQLM